MTLLENKKIRMNYEIKSTVTAGIELFGYEVKSLRNKLGSLDGSRVLVRGGTAYVLNMYIPPYQPENTPKNYDEHRSRQLLLRKEELEKLVHEEEAKLVLVPHRILVAHNLIKMEVAVCKKLQKHDKREKIKEKDYRNTN